MQSEDESSMTDIEIAPDGRVYIFGASRRVLELFREIGGNDAHLIKRLEAMTKPKASSEVPQSIENE